MPGTCRRPNVDRREVYPYPAVTLGSLSCKADLPFLFGFAAAELLPEPVEAALVDHVEELLTIGI